MKNYKNSKNSEKEPWLDKELGEDKGYMVMMVKEGSYTYRLGFHDQLQ